MSLDMCVYPDTGLLFIACETPRVQSYCILTALACFGLQKLADRCWLGAAKATRATAILFRAKPALARVVAPDVENVERS